VKRFGRAALALAAVGAAAASVAFLTAGSAAGTVSLSGTRTLQFIDVSLRFTPVPAISKTAPPQIGGRLVFQDVLYNHAPQFGKRTGALVGRAEGVCTLIVPSKPEAQCVITVHVPDGQIVAIADGDPGAKISRYAVTGGVGAYANARGTATVTSIDKARSIVVVHLST
jgi:hypothetical protein